MLVHEDCAYRSKLQRLDKIPDLQPHTAADRGTQIHQEAEDYVTGVSSLTHDLHHFADDLTSLAKHYAAGRIVCEEEWAFDRNWGVTEWAKGWLRLKCDAVCHLSPKHLVVIDYKTGKRFNNEIKHRGQLELYAVCAMLRYPKIDKVTCELWYFDQNELASFEMTRNELKRYLKLYDIRGNRMTNDVIFKPNPNIETCKYCPYRPGKQQVCNCGIDVDKVKAEAKVKSAQPIVFVKTPSPTDSMFE